MMTSAHRWTIWTCFWASAIAVRSEAQAWGPSRCVTDTLTVVQDNQRVATMDSVGPGIDYRCVLDRRGPWAMHLVTVDLTRAGLRVDAERAFGGFLGRERVSDMARRLQTQGRVPLVGVNADFFDLRTGEIENNHVVATEWVKGALRTDSPHDAFDNPHAQFGIDARGRPLLGRFALRGEAISGTQRQRLIGINYRQPGLEGLVLYTPWFGTRTSASADSVGLPALPANPAVALVRADSSRRAAYRAIAGTMEVELRRLGRRADTVLYRVSARTVTVSGGRAIPAHGAVLSAVGDSAIRWLRRAARGRGVVKVVQGIDQVPGAMQTIVGGWPTIVEHGINIAAGADRLEGTFPSFSANRHPRSAIGFTRDSSKILLLVVDGRRPWSVGMTLAELGEAMRSLGAHEAMNFDGGGSSALWIRGQIVNQPSDRTGERAVGNALFVLSQPSSRRPRR